MSRNEKSKEPSVARFDKLFTLPQPPAETPRRRRSDKPYLKLVGTDGNAFHVLGLALRAARAAGWTKEQQEVYADLAMSGDYDNLLAVTQEFFDVH